MSRFFILSLLASLSLIAKKKTNFVFFLVDDMGMMDLGTYGSTFHETPNIDKLAKTGMKFNYGYAACPVCSPTRASIMTGRHPVRVDITDWIPGSSNNKKNKLLHPQDRDNLALKEVTIAEELKSHGYQTFFAGKWHLGNEGHWPTDQGFDINIGGHHRGSPPGGYYSPWNNPVLKSKKKDEYLTERLTEESTRFLKKGMQINPSSSISPTTTFTHRFRLTEKYIHHYQKKAEKFSGNTPTEQEHEGQTRMRQDNPALASMVSAVDDMRWNFLAKLDELNLSDNTVIIFFSDNGGLSTKPKMGPGSNSPLRAGKGWLYEGGVREPTIIRAPGVTKAGSISNQPIVSMDFFPTMLELAGLPLRPKLHADGRSLLPELAGNKGEARPLYWHYPHYHGSTWTPGASIRDGDWKLIKFYDYEKVELYNLKNDPSESKDLSKQNPKIAKDLENKLIVWQKKNEGQTSKAKSGLQKLTLGTKKLDR